MEGQRDQQRRQTDGDQTGEDGKRHDVAAFLENNDAPCPQCGFNLRGLTGDVCPECAYVVRLQLAKPERELWAKLATALAVVSAISWTVIGAMMLRSAIMYGVTAVGYVHAGINLAGAAGLVLTFVLAGLQTTGSRRADDMRFVTLVLGVHCIYGVLATFALIGQIW